MKYFFTILLSLMLLGGIAFAVESPRIQQNLEKETSDAPVIPDPDVILQGGDNCSNYVELTGDLPITDNGNTSGYSNDYGPYSPEPDCWQGSYYPESNEAADVVYKFTAPSDALYTFSLCGSSYDTGLALYHFTCPDEPTIDDFICGNDDACSLQSELTDIALSEGDEILVVVDGYSTNSGSYSLTITSDEPTQGACCLDFECVGTMLEAECDATGGDWYEGYTCPEFECPQLPLDCNDAVYQNGVGNGGNTFASQCDPSYPFVAEVADDFVLEADETIGNITFYIGFWGGDGTPDDVSDITLTIYNDAGGVPSDNPTGDCSHQGDNVWTRTYSAGEFTVADDGMGGYQIDVACDVTLSGGVTYWLGMMPHMNLGTFGQSGWRNTTSQVGSPALLWSDYFGYYWQDPWGGYDVAFCLYAGGGAEETLVYSEDFDSGMGDWSGGWATTTEDYTSPPNSLTDSPGGNYGDNENNSVELMSDIDLTEYFGARLEFQTKFEIEQGFDYVYMDVSTDGGNNWVDFYTFNGEDPDEHYTWHLFEADLGGFVGQNIRFKFTLISDGAYTVDGMYIDDFALYGLNTDTSPPLILHEGPDETTSVPEAFTAIATITDISGVESAWLSYSVDGGEMEIANPDSTVDDDYYFTIPMVEAGAHVEYFISAVDNENNEGSSDTEHYVSGNVIYYDDGDAEFIYQYAAGDKVAVRFTPDDEAIFVTGLLRLYTDVNRPIDTVDVEVWANGSGNMPGQSMIDPFGVWPEATLEDPQAWTYVDFRGMGLVVDDDFHLGYTYRSEWPVILGDSPAITGRSSNYMFGNWSAATCDFHIRAIVDYGQVGVDDPEASIPESFSISQNYPNPFNAATVIKYAVTTPGDVELSVYNVLGQKVETLIKGHHDAGEYSITWNANHVPSGVYFAKIESSERGQSVKMVLLK
jgi:hypothetical protein